MEYVYFCCCKKHGAIVPITKECKFFPYLKKTFRLNRSAASSASATGSCCTSSARTLTRSSSRSLSRTCTSASTSPKKWRHSHSYALNMFHNNPLYLIYCKYITIVPLLYTRYQNRISNWLDIRPWC